MDHKNLVSILACGLAVGSGILIFSAGSPAQGETPVEHGNEVLVSESGDELHNRNALTAAPVLTPNWMPPSLPAGSIAAEEVGSLESRRDNEIDYPREARVARREGTSTVGFTIDKAGRVSDCVIVESSGDNYLDTGSCALILARGLYKPARDTNGNPLVSGKKLQIDWQLGWDVPQAPAESIIRLSFTVRPDGSFTDCWTDRGEGTQGISHPEMCRGSWPPEALALMRQISGPGDTRVLSINGRSLSEATMAAHIAERSGWHRFMGTASWYIVDEHGVAGNCQAQPFPGETSVESDPCSVPPVRFAPPLTADGKPTQVRFGKSFAYYIKLPEG